MHAPLFISQEISSISCDLADFVLSQKTTLTSCETSPPGDAHAAQRKIMIESVNNLKIRQIQQLIAKSRYRHKQGLFTAEGVKLFRETPPELRQSVFISESFEKNIENRELLSGVKYEVVKDSVFRKACDTQTPQGILTVARMPEYKKEDLLGKKENGAPLVMVLENLQDPGNVGTILRTGEGAGVTGVVLGPRTADIFQPKVIRSTMGSVFRVPFMRVKDLPDMIRWLKSSDVRVFAAHLKGNNNYHREDYSGGTAFLIGNEGSGLTEELSGMADCLIRIPMEGQVESLNASVAAALLMYNVHMQREEL